MKKNVTLFVASLILMSAAFWNKFPLIYPDIGTYLGSGFTPEMPIDRPISYGIFIFVTSLGGFSLWLTIFTQALMVAFVLRLTFDFILNGKISNTIFIGIITFLTIFTSVSFPTSQLMPDFSTPIMLLCLLLILVKAPLNIYSRRTIYFLIILTNSLHISHILLNMILLSILFITTFFSHKYYTILSKRQILQLMGFTMLGILTMLPPLSKSSHVFRMGNLVNNHILQVYLDDNCGTKNLEICRYKNEIPETFDAFVWSEKSPLNKMGWKTSKTEFNKIITDIYTTPKYLKMVVQSSLKNTWLQFQLNNVGEGNIHFNLDAPYIMPIETYCHAGAQFGQSKQYTSPNLVSPFLLNTHKIIICLSLLALIVYVSLLRNKYVLTPNKQLLIIGLLVSILINAWLAATLVYPHNRAGCKLIWFLPLILICLFLNHTKKAPSAHRKTTKILRGLFILTLNFVFYKAGSVGVDVLLSLSFCG
jgi:hypothetical protein